MRSSRNYKDIFIENSVPKAQRVMNSNMRNIIKAIGSDKLEFKGSRVQVKTQNPDEGENNSGENMRFSNTNTDQSGRGGTRGAARGQSGNNYYRGNRGNGRRRR